MYNVLYEVVCLQTGIYTIYIFVHTQICMLCGYGFKNPMLFFHTLSQSLIFFFSSKEDN